MKKKLFIIIFPLLLLLFSVLVYLLYYYNYIPHTKYENSDFGIKTYVSQMDKDQDGMDDQTDILTNVRKYIATKPKYKSKYYPKIGYPDDGYGVCTDVVGYGLLHAGYDLQELVFADRTAHPERYGDDEIDKQIDFRRVRNLRVYFEYHAKSLTTDIYDIKEWQGGDIIVFKKHIGIVSDKRNKKGVCFLIHHSGTRQKYYEEDILEHRNDIVAHYRIS